MNIAKHGSSWSIDMNIAIAKHGLFWFFYMNIAKHGLFWFFYINIAKHGSSWYFDTRRVPKSFGSELMVNIFVMIHWTRV